MIRNEEHKLSGIKERHSDMSRPNKLCAEFEQIKIERDKAVKDVKQVNNSDS